MSILIFSHHSTTRLQYICKFIFQEQLGIAYSLTIDAESFKEHDGPKMNYSDVKMDDGTFTLCNHPIMFEKEIKEHKIDCFTHNGYKAFFQVTQCDFPFDILAASFYLLSRYEEYLPHEKDTYGRYAHENSLAFKNDFLSQPLINIWLNDFAKTLQASFPDIIIKRPAFSFLPTYDIDIAWSYKNKGLIRNIGGFIKSPSLDRLSVLAGMKKDPFDSYAFLKELHSRFTLDPVYFFLVAPSGSEYDKNIPPYNESMVQLIKDHAGQYQVGLHPSWKSNENAAQIKKEKGILEAAANIEIIKSRQHYIKLALPDTFQSLIEAGIADDYSMGYGSINGFRASVASSFYWYNLKTETATQLRLHPFCFMDANSFYEEKQNAAEALQSMSDYIAICKDVHGQFISIFHNNFLGTDKTFAGWKEMYENFLEATARDMAI